MDKGGRGCPGPMRGARSCSAECSVTSSCPQWASVFYVWVTKSHGRCAEQQYSYWDPMTLSASFVIRLLWLY